VRRRSWLVPLALLAAPAIAQAGVVLFWPQEGVVEPDAVDVGAFFSPAQLARAEEYRGPQLALYLAGTTVQLGALAWLALRPPRRLTRAAAGRRVLLRVAGVAAVLSAGLVLVTLPLRAVSRQRGIDVGLVTRSWPGWAWDVVLSAAIDAGIAAATAVALVALMRRLPRWWWAPASLVVVAGSAGLLYAGPVVLDPLFNRFTPLQGQARADVLELARRSDIEVGEVLVMDASRRTTAANAYVAGLGRTKRVVVYDTLLEFPPAEQRHVLAHELGHQHYRDVPRGLLYVLLVAPAGLLAVAVLTRALDPRPGRADARTLPALALSISVVLLVMTAISNQLSRRVEARADTYALQLTGEARAFMEFERRISLRNVSDPDPPRWSHAVFGTHPTILERIGAGAAWARGARP
jgi:STE24 endopeptidase